MTLDDRIDDLVTEIEESPLCPGASRATLDALVREVIGAILDDPALYHAAWQARREWFAEVSRLEEEELQRRRERVARLADKVRALEAEVGEQTEVAMGHS